MKLKLHIPSLSELNYRQRLLSDPETMAYNRGYVLDFSSYDNNTGCITFPSTEWAAWYGHFINQRPHRFYAYLQEKESGQFVGEVNYHKAEEGYEIGIVMEACHRQKGYGLQGLALLLEQAFVVDDLPSLTNSFEKTRGGAVAIHERLGFQLVKEENHIIYYSLSQEKYSMKTAPYC